MKGKELRFKLRHILVGGIIGLIVLLLGAQGAVLSYSISNLITSEVYSTSSELLEQKSIRLNEKMSEVKQVSLIVALNDDIKGGLSRAKDMNYYEQVVFLGKTNDLLTDIANARDDISQIIIINDDLKAKNYSRPNKVIDSSYIKDQDVLSIIESGEEGIIATKGNYLNEYSSVKSVVTYYRKLWGLNMQDIGTLCIVLDESALASIIQEPDRGETSTGHITYVVDEQKQLITPYDEGELITDEVREIAESEIAGGGNGVKISVYDQEFYGIATKYNDYGLKIIQLKPYDVINASVKHIFRMIALIGLICVGIAVVVVHFFSNSILKPVKHLLEQMNYVGKGDFDISTERVHVVEIDELNHGFERMTKRIRYLIDEVHEKHQKMRLAEFSALQSQINPHFLYNTLNAINWMAIRIKAHDISQMVSDLSGMFRIGISDGRDFIAIEKEVEHLRMYMKIESYRYSNRFRFNETYDEVIFQCQTIKLILQPLVENSLIHGLGHVKGNGTIKVEGYLEGASIIFLITDDGIGVDPEKMNQLLLNNSVEGEGFGIRNTNERIKIHYGDDYGLTYLKVEKGTSVKVAIPKVTQ